MIDICDISGLTKISVSPLEGSVHRFQLMKEDYVLLRFTLAEPVYFEVGDFADIDGSRYYIADPVYPTFNTSTAGYDYELRMESHYYIWKNHILFYDRQGNKEASWSLTRSPEAHLSIVVSNLQSIGFTYNGTAYQAVVDSTVDTAPKLVQYENTNIIDALTKIAEAWDCEWWVDGNKIYLGRLEHGEPIDLEIGKEIASMSRSQSQDIYATRLYVFGSTRNIPSDYRKGQSGTVVEGIVQKRLMLPAGTPYIDVVSGLNDKEVVEAVVIIDDVYPRMTGTMTSVKPVQRTTEAAEGEDPETFTAYQFKDSSLTFSKEYILPGETLRIQFQSGPLSGMEFDVTFNPDKIEDESKPEAQVFEIVRNDDYGQYLPQSPLIPGVGNQYILYNFDTQYVSDELIPEAEQELLEKALALKDKMVADPSTYNCVLNSYRASGYDENNGTLNPSKAIDLTAGQKVNLINKAYFKNGRVTRIIGFEKKLDIPYDSPSYTVGETAAYSRLGELEQRIESIQVEGNTYVNQGGGGGFGVYIIKKEDTTAASDSNVFSALRTLAEIDKVKEEMDEMYLRKDINDTAHGIILFDQKIGSSVFIDGWEGKGWEITDGGAGLLDSLRVRSDIFLGNRLGSDTFVSGFPNGYGWEITPYQRTNSAGTTETKYRLEIDDINVRGKLRAYEFVISQLRGENDNVIFAGMMKVDHYDATERRLYLDTEEGVLYNPFRSGDILMVQRFGGMPTAESDYNVIKQYELRVDEAGIGNLSDGEDRLDWITFTNFVGDISDITEGDVLTRVDSVADSTRKGIVKVTTIDEIGAPYIDVVYGMKTDPENATRARMGNLTGIRTKNGIDLTGVWGIYGSGAYFENSTYILDNGNTIEQQFTIINGTLESTIGELRNDMSLEPGNILRNSSFSRDTNYWETGGTVNLWAFNGQFIYANDTFISEKDDFAGIYQDGSRNVLRIRNSYVLQRNDVMDIPVHEEGDEDWTYSFSFFYKVLQAGTLTAGFSGSALYLSQQLQPTDEYQKLSKVADWNEQGDFRISFTGEILIYGVSLFNDALADAEIRLQTQITQNAEMIALKAEKTYVDSETGKIYEKYDGEIKVMADDIALRVTYEDFNTESQALEKRLESRIELTEENINLSVTEQVNSINAVIESVQTAVGEAKDAAEDVADSVTSLNEYVDGAFKNGMIEDAEAKAIEKYINTVNSIKKDVDSTYATLYNNLYLDGDPKTNLYNAKRTFDSAISSLIDTINSVISDQKVTEAEKGSVDSKFDAFNNAYAGLATSIESANKAIQDKLKGYSDSALAAANAANAAASKAQESADAAGQSVTDLDNEIKGSFRDGIITDAEKISIGKYLNTVDSTMSDVEATYTKLYANTYLEGTPKSNLKTAYDNLKSAYDSLVAAIEDATADSTASETEFAAVNTQFATFNSRLSTFKTSIESANKAIQDKLNELANTGIASVRADLNIEKARISANVTAIDNINQTIEDSGWITTADGNQLWARKDNIISTINQSPESISIDADRINLNGTVTFSMFSSSLQDRINGKADSDDLGALAMLDTVGESQLSAALKNSINNKLERGDMGDLAFKDKIGKALLDETLIKNGVILTTLIDTDAIYANMAQIGDFSIESGSLVSNKMKLYPSSGLYFEDSGRGIISRFGAQTIPSSTGVSCNLFLRNTDNSGTGMTNGACMTLEVGNPTNTNGQKWISCSQASGWGAGFTLEAKYVGDDNGMSRTCITIPNILTDGQLKNKFNSSPQFHFLVWDIKTGMVCMQI